MAKKKDQSVARSVESGVDFLKQIIKETKNPYASIAGDGTIYDSTGFIDVGNYLLNLQLGGDMFTGVPSNMCTCFAGQEGVGKTYIILGIVKSFLDANPTGVVSLFESEGAIKKKSLEERGIDVDRVSLMPIGTIEEFRFQCNKTIDGYAEIPKKDRFPILIALDSLGMLSDDKEVGDAKEGLNKADMGGHARRIKATFRVIRQKLALHNIPLFITNHLYAEVGALFTSHKVAGGSGIKYAADSILVLNKRKIKTGDESFEDGGISVNCKGTKLRETRPHTEIPFTINFTHGVTRYSGLFQFCLDYGAIVKQGMQYTFCDEVTTEEIKFFKKTILENPEKYFTNDVLIKLNEVLKPIFLFGNSVEKVINDDEEEEVEE